MNAGIDEQEEQRLMTLTVMPEGPEHVRYSAPPATLAEARSLVRKRMQEIGGSY